MRRPWYGACGNPCLAIYERADTAQLSLQELLSRQSTDADNEVRRIEKFHNLSKLHEVERDMKRPQETLDQLLKTIADYKALWDMVGEFGKFQEECKSTLWMDLEGPKLEEDARNILGRCKKLPKPTKKSPAFKGIDTLCKEFFIAAPLAGSVRVQTCTPTPLLRVTADLRCLFHHKLSTDPPVSPTHVAP